MTMDVEQVWSDIVEVFPVLAEKPLAPNVVDKNKLVNIQNTMEHLDLYECIYELVWIELGSVIRHQVVPKFWQHFAVDTKPLQASTTDKQMIYNSTISELNYKQFGEFVAAVKELGLEYCALKDLLDHLELIKPRSFNGSNIQERCGAAALRETLREALLADLPASFNIIVYDFYFVSFRVFAEIYQNHDDVDMQSVLNESYCSGCNAETDKCCCRELKDNINETNKTLQYLELLDGIAGQAITLLVQKLIKEHINDTCQGIFERSFLKYLETWLDEVVISWLTRVLNNGNLEIEDDNLKIESVIQRFKVKLTYFLYENLAHSIIEQFFSIIIDFPDSTPAIDDLKICMEKIDLRKQLIKTLKNSLKARILHPGVNTVDILTGYVAAIKAIRYLDNSGVILETVTAPIKEYLRKRNDTVRRVVTALTEDGPTDLSEELAKSEAFKENMNTVVNEELSNWENWQPDPFGLEPTTRTPQTNVSRSADIIAMVVDIYGSKELFMNEYRNLMADRLLTQLNFNPEKEIRNLELLKLRFGESLLHSCEVMLKDVADSKRINVHIQSDTKYKENKLFDISTLIISAQFWPSFNKESLELPEEIANEFNKYTKSYESYKGNRTLNWRNVTGRVQIAVEIGERSFEMNVPPTQAVILYHFQHKNEWTLDELSQLIKLPTTVLRRRIGFWQVHGLINETRPGVFKLIEEGNQKAPFDEKRLSTLVTGDDDMESAMASASDQREEELQVFWSYIVGMLTNLDSLPIERIHQMLKLFASNGIGIDFTQDELKDFLQRKVREHTLLFSGGVYQLPK